VIPRDVEAKSPAGQFISQSAVPIRSNSVICERDTLGSRKTQETRGVIQRSSFDEESVDPSNQERESIGTTCYFKIFI